MKAELSNLLMNVEEFVVSGVLNKNKLSELARKYDAKLLNLLMKEENVKNHFFTTLEDGVLVFQKDVFLQFLNNKEFLPDSYTAFKTKIGLGTDNGDYLSENNNIVLNFPYKDCILEGGQTKEDTKRQEVFFNKTLAPNEINRLLDNKVLTNFKRYDKDGEYEVENIEDTDNLIIKGNNLIALHSLKKRYSGKVRLIYIDPPYNTGSDSFTYNDSFNHSTWLTFMKNRLQVAKELLTEDGTIWINIDDDEGHYLKIIADEIFGRINFVNTIIWQKKFAPQNDAKWFSDNHDFILVYAKNKLIWKPNLLPRTEEMNSRYKNPDNDPRGVWTSGDLSVKTYSEKTDYPIITPSGRVINPPSGRCWRTSKEKFLEMVSENRIWFGEKGDSVPRIKRFLSEVKDGIVSQTIWKYEEVSHTQEAIQNLNKLFGEKVFGTPKPEKLIQRIIQLGSEEGDIILDFFMGSGTTQAVAHKMNRQYIGIEQMDYIETVSVERLKKVIEGEQGGISKDVKWQGGGSFVYCELKNDAQDFLNKVENALSSEELVELLEKVKKSSFLSYRVDAKKLHKEEFNNLSLFEQKQLLVELIDQNNLYVNYSDINDVDNNISEKEKQLNTIFYL